MDRLGRFLELWFGQQSGEDDDPASTVGRLLRFNHPAPTGKFDGAVEVPVVENQGVWLWGRDADDRYVERENEPGLLGTRLARAPRVLAPPRGFRRRFSLPRVAARNRSTPRLSEHRARNNAPAV